MSNSPGFRGERCRTALAFRGGLFLISKKVLHPQKYDVRETFASEFAKVDAASSAENIRGKMPLLLSASG